MPSGVRIEETPPPVAAVAGFDIEHCSDVLGNLGPMVGVVIMFSQGVSFRRVSKPSPEWFGLILT